MAIVAMRDASFNRSGRGASIPKYHRATRLLWMAGCDPTRLLLNEDTARDSEETPDSRLCHRKGCFPEGVID